MTVDDEVWLALSNLRASHLGDGCQPADCAIASLDDQDLLEILHVIPQDDSTRVVELQGKLARAEEHLARVAAMAPDVGWPPYRETTLNDARIEQDTAAPEIAARRPVVEAAQAALVADAAPMERHLRHRLSFEGSVHRACDVVPAAHMAVVGSGERSRDGVTTECEGNEPRFQVGDRVVYDPEIQINKELEGDYTHLGVCTVTALDVEGSGPLLSFVDERGNMHDGWWADRFKAAPVQATAEDGEDDVTYFVAFRSATGYGYRVLVPRPRIVTAADVVALTDLLATDLGPDVVPLNWIELPPPLPEKTQARQVASNGGSSTEIRSTLAPIRIDRGNDHRVLSMSVPATGGTPQTQPVRAAALGERPDLPYLPRRAM